MNSKEKLPLERELNMIDKLTFIIGKLPSIVNAMEKTSLKTKLFLILFTLLIGTFIYIIGGWRVCIGYCSTYS